MNVILNGLLLTARYPIVNNEWEIGDSVYSLHYYIESYVGGRIVSNYDVSNYVGIRNYFVRISEYEFDCDNRDPWNRRFFAYSRGSRTIMNNHYICRPLIDGGGDILMYVMTTSVEGQIVYCLDVLM
jgi:hypothetical protein